jgi:hypothetical protein
MLTSRVWGGKQRSSLQLWNLNRAFNSAEFPLKPAGTMTENRIVVRPSKTDTLLFENFSERSSARG